MQRFLTAAAVVGSMALMTSGLALAQGSTTPRTTTAPSATMLPQTGSQSSSTNPGINAPSTGATTGSSAVGPSAANTGAAGTQSPEMIKQAQQQLKAQGLYKGTIDGQMGPETASALSKFQQKNGLPANSGLDQATMTRLGGGTSSNMGSGSSTPPSTMNPSMTPTTGAGGSSATNPDRSPGTSGMGTSGTGTSGTGTTTR